MEPLLTVADVAELCNVSKATIRIWAQDGRLTGIKPGGTEWRFHPDDVATFLASTPPPEEQP